MHIHAKTRNKNTQHKNQLNKQTNKQTNKMSISIIQTRENKLNLPSVLELLSYTPHPANTH
jgi:hypothetical protein